MKIGIIGSGIAGLSAGWLLGRSHEVVLYERHSALGMDAFSIDVDGTRLDVPMRLNYDTYYTNLLALYDLLDIKTRPSRSSGTFIRPDGQAYFRLRSVDLGPLTLPRFSGPDAAQVMRDGWRLYTTAQKVAPTLGDETLADFFKREGYSEAFAERFFLPLYANICTCSYEAMRNYPAQVVLDSIVFKTFFSGFKMLQQVEKGTQEVVRKLSAEIDEVRLNTTVAAVCRNADQTVTVQEQNGHSDTFDHVIIATQANHALNLLADGSAEELRTLAAFPYESCEVVIHTDERLAPPRREDWSAINFIVGPDDKLPYATAVMNAMQPELRDKAPIFHTLNPQREVDPAKVINRTWFERPIVNSRALAAWQTLDALQAEPGRRVWFAGAYASYGMTLQEGAVKASRLVAERLGVSIPWDN